MNSDVKGTKSRTKSAPGQMTWKERFAGYSSSLPQTHQLCVLTPWFDGRDPGVIDGRQEDGPGIWLCNMISSEIKEELRKLTFSRAVDITNLIIIVHLSRFSKFLVWAMVRWWVLEASRQIQDVGCLWCGCTRFLELWEHKKKELSCANTKKKNDTHTSDQRLDLTL